VQSAGLIPTIVGMGLVYVAVNLGMFLNPALRGMDARPDRAAAAPAPAHPPSAREAPARSVDVR
jgi:hypothetical protein